MPKAFFRKAYDQWLLNNHQRFIHSPYIVKNRKSYIILGFIGIHRALTCRITSYGFCEIRVDISKECDDIIMEFDVYARRNREGQYYCSECKKRNYYSTRTELWEVHTFEAMLEWINNINDKHIITLNSFDTGGCEARLFNGNNIPKSFTSFSSIPVVVKTF